LTRIELYGAENIKFSTKFETIEAEENKRIVYVVR